MRPRWLAGAVAAVLLAVQASAGQPAQPVNVQYRPHGTLTHPRPDHGSHP